MRSLWLEFFHPLSTHFRKKRFSEILHRAPELLSKRILDVGGSVHFWEEAGVSIGDHDITILNIALDGQSADSRGQIDASSIVIYDGSTIPYPDLYFDWVISNSVIEHVAPEQRDRFCSEIKRVGRNYIVQTPAFAFPIEPHFILPLLHWIPRTLARRLAGFGLWGLLRRRTRSGIETYFDEVHLLRFREFCSFFPKAQLITERFAGIPKSYTLIGKCDG
jgi:hypothetical protein